MAYTINKTDGTVLTTIADGTVDSRTNLTLIGKNYAGYGDFLNENLIRLLENAANTTAPASPIAGQLWWDKANNLLKVNTNGDSTGWKALSSSASQATAPTSALTGDLWWDTTNKQLNVYNGTGYTLVGPAFTAGTGQSGISVGTIVDSSSASHVAVNVYVSNTLVSIISKDAAYTPQSTITGFGNIKPGYNLVSASTINGVAFNGTATNASALNDIPYTSFARTDVAAVHTGTITVNNNSGITVGTSNNITTLVSANTAIIQNNINNSNIAIKANVQGTLTTALAVNGSSGLVEVAGVPTTSLGIATKSYVDSATGGGTSALLRDGSRSIQGSLLPDVNTSYNLGSSSYKFANVYATYLIGTSIQAQYADLAERFHADQSYPAGTVVALGGPAEVTATAEDLSEDVFGVVSTQAAYLMNAGAGSDATHPAIAVNGRVPVRVVGRINKGDRLVAAGNGLARAGSRTEISSFNVIGRALESKTSDGEGTILAIVKLNS